MTFMSWTPSCGRDEVVAGSNARLRTLAEPHASVAPG
jgi:hypothetical protein